MRSRIFHLCSSVFICGSLLLLGCQPKKPPPKPRYEGPTETMAQVVKAINDNNRRIPTLYASIRTLEVSIVEEGGKRHDEVMHGRLLYRAPGEVLLVGGKALVNENLIHLGSNAEQYWLIAQKPIADTTWWGRYKHLGKPCAQPIPIRPDLVLEVLGVATIKEDFTRLPAPVMRYNAEADAYMFVWVTQLKFPDGHDTDRFVVTKEVWYDRRTHRPIRVALFDAHGRPTLHAILSNHKPIEIRDVPEQDRPVIAGEFKLYFPDSRSSLRLELGDVALTSSGRIKAPNNLSFAFNPDTTNTSKVIQLDEACGD